MEEMQAVMQAITQAATKAVKAAVRSMTGVADMTEYSTRRP